MKDEFFEFLVATDQVDEFLGLKDEYKDIDKEIKEIEEYILRLERNGIYTDYQKEDLEFNKKRLKELKNIKKEQQR